MRNRLHSDRMFRCSAISRALAPLLSLLVFAVSATAAPLDDVETTYARVEIFAEPPSTPATDGADSARFWLAVRFTPDEGWHTYWKNYGDTGKAPHFDWELPDGWRIAPPLYPVPERIPVGFLMNYGYGHPNTLLFEVTPTEGAAFSEEIGLNARWLICEEVCVPESARFDFTLPGNAAPDASTQAVFNAARDALPDPIPFAVSAEASDAAFALSVFMSPDEASLVRDAYYFPEEKDLIDYQVAQRLETDQGGLRLQTARPDAAGGYERSSGILVIENAAGKREGFELTADIARNESLAAPASDGGARVAGVGTEAAAGPGGEDLGITVLQALLFAVLGGMILNLMPCVFPVLSLKAFALIRSHGAGETAARQDGLAYAAGILASFAVIAGLFIALKAAGAQIGWGFQLQSPVIVSALALLLFLVGLNLLGVYDLSGRFTGIGQGLAERGGRTGAFFTGVLATVVATPCTAPFMAPALGFALFQPAPVAFGIFLSLGLGLALPYLLIAYSPPLRRALPKPGPWMETFKQFLAFPMFLAAIWLVWVLAQQRGAEAVAGALGAMLAGAFAIWLVQRLRGRSGLAAPTVGLVAGVLVSVGVLGLPDDVRTPAGGIASVETPAGDSAGFERALGVEPWSKDRVAELRTAGRPVFAYFTAAWCITCKVNERVALASDRVRDAVERGDIAVLKADWTNQNAEIARELERFGRSGVPMYVFYPAGGGAPRLLPEVLTPEILTNAFSPDDPAQMPSG